MTFKRLQEHTIQCNFTPFYALAKGGFMRRFIRAATILSAFASAAPAQAANLREFPSWYWGISGGVAFLQSSDIRGTSTGKVKFDDGGMGALTLGYTPNAASEPWSALRFEAELGYHYNNLTRVEVGGVSSASDAGVRSVSYMANGFYDIRNGGDFTPYLGAGIGGAQVRLGRKSGAGNTDDTDNVLAYQFMAGLYYTPPGIPTTQWGIGYRYFVEDSPEFTSATGKVKLDDIASHNVEISARFRF